MAAKKQKSTKSLKQEATTKKLTVKVKKKSLKPLKEHKKVLDTKKKGKRGKKKVHKPKEFTVKLLYSSGPGLEKAHKEEENKGLVKGIGSKIGDFFGFNKSKADEEINASSESSAEGGILNGSFCPVKVPDAITNSSDPSKYLMRVDLAQRQLSEIVDYVLQRQHPIDTFNPYSPVVDYIEKNYGIGRHAIRHMLNIMTQCGIVEKKTQGKIPICPTDDSSHFVNRYNCPYCSHSNFEVGETYEHLHCGHIDFANRYWNNTCPKCSEKLSQLGVDYIKTDSHFKCNSCGEYFGEPMIFMECQRCKRKYDTDKVNWKDHFIFIPNAIHDKDKLTICKSCFIQKVESLYELKVPELPTKTNDVIIFPMEDYPRVLEEYFREVNRKKKECIYVSLNKTCCEVQDMYKDLKIPIKNMHIVDCVSKDFGEKVCKSDACMSSCSQNNLRELNKILMNQIAKIKRSRKNKKEKPLILFDSCSTLLAYHPFEEVNSFMHHFIIELKNAGIPCVFLTIAEASQEQFLAQLIQYSDHFYEL